MRTARPCTPPTPVDTTGWREARRPGGGAGGVLLPADFAADSAARLSHGVLWRAGKRSFARATRFWGPGDADTRAAAVPCRLDLGGRPYVVTVHRDAAGVALGAFPVDTTSRETEGFFAASAVASDLPLLWTALRHTAPSPH